MNWIPVVPGAVVGNPGDRFSEKVDVLVGLDDLLAQPEHAIPIIRVNAIERSRLHRSLLWVEPDKAASPHYICLVTLAT